MSMLLMPTVINPVAANTAIGPAPIPGNLVPPPNAMSVSPIIPSNLNLGVVSTALPSVSLYSINQVKSGLVASDPLNNETQTQQQLQANQKYWKYGGDAPALNAKYDFFKDTQGLHIGAQAPASGTYAGYYAVTPNTNAALFHAVITAPTTTISSNFYENGMYIQTSTINVNYVTCFSDTSQWGTVWAVVSATGNPFGITNFNLLWFDQSANQPLTRDCTIITNGNNYLKVYLDGVMVYSNSTLNLQMPGPYNAYLEPQSSYTGKLLNGTYTNYYAASDENIKVINNPILAATVKLVDSTGKVLATAPVNSGDATLSIGQYHMPLAAYVKVYDSNGIQLASTSSPVNIFGGDVYSVNLLGLRLPI